MTIRRVLSAIFAVLLLLPAPSAAQEPDSVAFLERCEAALEVPDGSPTTSTSLEEFLKLSLAAMCLGYVDGVMATNAMYQGVLLEPDRLGQQHETGLFCTPLGGVTVAEAIRIIVDELEGMTLAALRRTTPRAAVVTALAQTYPCNGNGQLRISR